MRRYQGGSRPRPTLSGQIRIASTEGKLTDNKCTGKSLNLSDQHKTAEQANDRFARRPTKRVAARVWRRYSRRACLNLL